MTRLRKARKPFDCTECRWRTVQAGQAYLSCVMVPWHEMNQSGKYQHYRACLRCADRYGLHTSETRAAAEALESIK